MFGLAGKRIVVIGGAGLLGSAFSRACVRGGAQMIIADSDKKKGAALARELSAAFVQVDVSSPSSVAALARRVGTVDGVVHAAYPRTKQFGKLFEKAQVENMLQDLDLHVGSCLSITKAFAPLMKKHGGSIIFMGSIYGVVAPRFDIYNGTGKTLPAEYAASKGAIIMLAKYFASLYGKYHIRFNAISPGGIADTAAKNQPEKFIRQYARHLKIGGGLLQPEDVAGTVLYLLSDASRQVTGQNVVVDGGWTT